MYVSIAFFGRLIYDPLIAGVLCARRPAPLMAACTALYLMCIPYLLGSFDFLKHRMMSRALRLCGSYPLETLMHRALKLLHVFHGLPREKQRD